MRVNFTRKHGLGTFLRVIYSLRTVSLWIYFPYLISPWTISLCTIIPKANEILGNGTQGSEIRENVTRENEILGHVTRGNEILGET
jgi:hypothetical protein